MHWPVHVPRRGRSLLPALLVCLLGILPGAASAFCPKNGFVCLLTSKSSGSMTHEDITRRSVESIDKTHFGVTKLTKSMEKALDQIVDADAAVDEDQTSSAKHFDGENDAGAQLRLKELKQNVLDALAADPINASGARENLGGALHTIQDFYSHSNWIEFGNAGPNPGVGRGGLLGFAGPATPTCSGSTGQGLTCANYSNLVGSALTSGYYGGEDRTKPGSFKCSHGGPLDGSSPSSDIFGYFREGINKDTRYCDISPHSRHHDAAAAAAVAATTQFIEDIRAVVTVKQFKALLGAGPSLAFAVDTTGSMGGIIAGVRATTIAMVNARLGTDEEPSQYVLSPFNDPYIGPLTVTNDAAVYKGALSGLFASGGGDCPELAMSGTYAGVAAADAGGDLYIFTDATAKDSGLIGSVASLATSKDIRIFPILFGSCSPTDPAYIQLATLTGGQIFYLFPSEAATVTQLTDLLARNNAVQLLSVVDSFGTAKSYTVPADGTVTRLTFSASSYDQFSVPRMVVQRPDGSTVAAGDPGVTQLALSRATVLSIQTPAVGNWKVSIDNSPNPTYLNVTGESPLRLNSFKFAAPGGQPPHQGLFTIQGSPLGGQHLYAMAGLTSGFRSVSFELRRKDFSLITTPTLEVDQTDPTRYWGPITIPNEPFLAYAVGTDTSGKAFRRVLPLSSVPQTIELTAPGPQDLRPGKLTTLIYQVRNIGTPGTFSFKVADDRSYVSSVSPATLTLGAGESGNVVVKLLPPAGAKVGTADTLTATIENVSNSAIRNSAVRTLYVTGATTVAGKPNFVAKVVGQSKVSEGVYAIDVRFNNIGPGTAAKLRINSLSFKTLSGTGLPGYNTTLGPPLPLELDNVDVGDYQTIRLLVNVPSTVKRFSVVETGTVSDTGSAVYSVSQAQAVIPQP